MRVKTMLVMAALAALALGATSARAQVDVDLAFDPAVANVGEPVTFFASVANLGAEAVVADLELTITFDTIVIGPLTRSVPLAAGEELSVEIPFVALFPGELTVTLTATAGGSSDTATATLTVVGDGGVANPQFLQELADAILDGLAASPVSVDPTSWSAVKNLYR